jgi:hypothetical protein
MKSGKPRITKSSTLSIQKQCQTISTRSWAGKELPCKLTAKLQKQSKKFQELKYLLLTHCKARKTKKHIQKALAKKRN